MATQSQDCVINLVLHLILQSCQLIIAEVLAALDFDNGKYNFPLFGMEVNQEIVSTF